MADCVFCGQKAAFGKTITVGTMVFKACADCYDRYSGQDEKIIVDAVKAARIFNDDVKLREWYDNRISDLKKDAELYRSEIDDYERELKEKTVGICPKCGGPMFGKGEHSLMTYVGGLPTLNRSAWNTGEFNVRITVCQQCGYTEFYSAAGNSIEKLEKKRERLKMIEEELGEE